MSEQRRSSPPCDIEQVVRSVLLVMVTGVDEPSVFTHDVTDQTPLGEVCGRDDLVARASDWRDGLTSPDLLVEDIAVDGTTAMVRWQLAALHTGDILLNEDLLFERTGRRVTLRVVTEFGFRGELVCSFRHDYDLDDLLRQLHPESAAKTVWLR
jgi:hypothetical protein